MEFDKAIINEDSLRISKIKIGFKDIVHDNYTDCHNPMRPFGSKWGRGVIVKGNGFMDAIIGSYGTSHAQLKKQMQPGENSAGTFYYGYDPVSKNIFLEYGSDRTFDFKDVNILNAIMDGLKNSNTPFKNFIVE